MMQVRFGGAVLDNLMREGPSEATSEQRDLSTVRACC